MDCNPRIRGAHAHGADLNDTVIADARLARAIYGAPILWLLGIVLRDLRTAKGSR